MSKRLSQLECVTLVAINEGTAVDKKLAEKLAKRGLADIKGNEVFVSEEGHRAWSKFMGGGSLKSLPKKKGKTTLDLMLDKVKRGEQEISFDTEGYTEEQVKRIVTTAEARGLHASYDGRVVLVRDLSNP